MGVFFSDMRTRILTVIDLVVADKAALGFFNVLDQVLDLRAHVGIRRIRLKNDAQQQDNGEDGYRSDLNCRKFGFFLLTHILVG